MGRRPKKDLEIKLPSHQDLVNINDIAGPASITTFMVAVYRLLTLNERAAHDLLWTQGLSTNTVWAMLKDNWWRPWLIVYDIYKELRKDSDKVGYSIETKLQALYKDRKTLQGNVDTYQGTINHTKDLILSEQQKERPNEANIKVWRDSLPKLYANRDNEVKKIDALKIPYWENLLIEQRILINVVIPATGAIMVSQGMMYLQLHPDVTKAIISSMEKVSIRLIDETSEVIDKSGEAIKDTINSLYPWKGII